MNSDFTQRLTGALEPHGLVMRGGFHLQAHDDLGAGTLAMAGNSGIGMWETFAGDVMSDDNSLDAWTRKTIEPIAAAFAARAIYPFDRPHPPFQQWAKRAEGLPSSPLGILIHPQYGLWHAYRAALVFPNRVAAFDEPLREPENPCESCSEKPCLTACPVDAFSVSGYDVNACAGYLSAPGGQVCLETGCAARNACPVGREFKYSGPQIRFHMAAFSRSLARR